MSTLSAYETMHRERLSALVDGELDAAALRAACECWHGETEARRDWHAWQLAGDVLRSEDLASDARRDIAFLAVVRGRLAQEPVVLAPLQQPVLSVRATRWWIPASIAAGFVLVVGTFTLTSFGPVSRTPPVAAADQIAVAAADPLLRPAALRDEGAGAARTFAIPSEVVDGRLVRDARLDRYLTAHKQFAGTSALGIPSVFLRGETVGTAPSR